MPPDAVWWSSELLAGRGRAVHSGRRILYARGPEGYGAVRVVLNLVGRIHHCHHHQRAAAGGGGVEGVVGGDTYIPQPGNAAGGGVPAIRGAPGAGGTSHRRRCQSDPVIVHYTFNPGLPLGQVVPATKKIMSRFHMTAHLFVILLCCMSCSRAQESYQQSEMTVNMKEYCHLEVFNATCPPGRVLLMQYARYGRMKIGRCLTTSYYIGCYADILNFADARCSGRPNCVIRVLDPELVTFQPCRKDLMAYLEASYICVPIQSQPSAECPSEGQYEITEGAGYLSLGDTGSVIGTASCPWFVRVQPGQRVIWTLYDFNDVSYKNNMASNTPKCPYSFKFLEGDAEVDVPVCTGRQRESDVYTTRRHYVKVYMLRQTSTQHPTKFLLSFRAVGCPDFQPVPDAWVRRSESTAVVVCNNTRETWHFVCRDHYWVGELRNCTQQPKADVITANGGFRYNLHYGILLAVALGLVLGVFFGAVLLVCMFVHRVRKRHRKRPRRADRDLLHGESLEDKDAVSIPLRHGDHFDSTAGYLTEDNSNLCGHTVHYQFPTDDGQGGNEDGPDIIYTSRMNIRCQSNCVACQGPQVLGVRGLGIATQGGQRSQDTILSASQGRNGQENIYDTRKMSESIYGMRANPDYIVNGTMSKNNRINEIKENLYDTGKRVLFSKSASGESVDKQVVTTL